MPLFVFFFGVAGLASLGLPGLAGFVAEFNIFVGAFETYPWAAALGVFAAAHHGGVHPAHDGDGVLRRSLTRGFDLKEMTYLERATGVLMLDVHAVHGPLARAVRRPHPGDGAQHLPGVT